MRLPRRGALLVALSLLTSAATASAECSWVLWTYGSYSSFGAYSAPHHFSPVVRTSDDLIDEDSCDRVLLLGNESQVPYEVGFALRGEPPPAHPGMTLVATAERTEYSPLSAKLYLWRIALLTRLCFHGQS